MEIRRAYLRRSMKRARLQKRVAVAAMLGVAGCAALLLQQQAQRPERDAAMAPSMAAPAAAAVLPVAAEASPAVARRVYPYSIVPGGVSDRIELARAVMTDRVVAAHYAGFALDRASLRTVTTARAVYVSYRKGDQVYWTARKVTLAEGESVLSDGQNEIRARCGNRISDTPQLPVEVKGPDERELDSYVEQNSYAEQAQDDGDGAVREVAFALDDQHGEGQRFALQSFPNAAGLLAAAQAPADLGQASLDSQFDADRRQALLAGLAGPVYDLRDRTAGSSATNGGATGTAGEPAAGTGGTVTAGSGSGGTSDTATGGSGGTATGSTGADSPGSKPVGGTPADPPAPIPVPGTEPLPGGNLPAKPHELPEPGGLWLTGVAAAVLLLQRRLRPRRPR
jgi:hypothetical protein